MGVLKIGILTFSAALLAYMSSKQIKHGLEDIRGASNIDSSVY